MSFQTVAEVRYGALLRGWGELGIPLVSNDGVFDNTPGVAVESART